MPNWRGSYPAPLRHSLSRGRRHRRPPRHPRPGGPSAGRTPLRGRVKPDCSRPSPRPPSWKGLRCASWKTSLSGGTLPAQRCFYASLARARFVLSHGRNLLIFSWWGTPSRTSSTTATGFQGPRLDRPPALSHQGPVCTPAARTRSSPERGAGTQRRLRQLHSVCEYLRQRNIHQQFLTDTEVSVQLFDLWDGSTSTARVHHRGPGSDHRAGFDQLPRRSRPLPANPGDHIHASPDGPGSSSSPAAHGPVSVAGHHDTAMLRPQVFALSDSGEVQVG